MLWRIVAIGLLLPGAGTTATTWLQGGESARAVCCETASLQSDGASGDQAEQGERWRLAKIAELEAKLAGSNVDRSREAEWRARRDWLHRWQPGRMPPPPKEAADDGSNDSSRSEALVTEPDLAELKLAEFGAGASPVGPLSEEQRERLERAVRLQQRLRRLDSDEERKANLLATAEVARQLDETLAPLVDQFRSDASSADCQELGDSLRWALAHARYRRARAIAYRELPDVLESLPIEDAVEYERQLAEAHDRLRRTFAEPRPEFVLLEIRILRRAGARGQALERLEQFAWAIAPHWYLQKRRDLLEELGWGPPHAEAAELAEAAGRAESAAK